MNEKCSFCLEEINSNLNIKDNENKILLKECNHIFHYNCLKEWIDQEKKNSNCPICRLKIKNFLIIKSHDIESFLLEQDFSKNFDEYLKYISIFRFLSNLSKLSLNLFVGYCKIKFYLYIFNSYTILYLILLYNAIIIFNRRYRIN